jgi:hypothetical protein
MEPKLSVSTDKELLRIGADVVDLQDASTATYKTDDLGEFLRFAGIMDTTPESSLVIFYNAEQVQLFDSLVMVQPRLFDPMALCKMARHPRLEALTAINGKTMDADEFEALIRKLRKNLGSKGLELLDNLSNLTVSKATKVERKKDKRGNYTYLVSRESNGAEDFAPPETLTFSVPLFIGVEEAKPLEFDFRFDFKQKDGDVALMFTLESLNLREDLIHASAEVLQDALSVLEGVKSYRGELSRKIETDAWSKKINGINL